MPIISLADRLSRDAAEILEALVHLDRIGSPLIERLRSLPGHEVVLINERLMVQARQVQEWGTPSVLWGLLTLIEAKPSLALVFARFLEGMSTGRLRPDIVPALGDQDWAKAALDKWCRDRKTPQPVRRAIKALTRERI